MKNNITEIVFILDRSGSMSGLESDTIGGFNSFIERQKKEDGKAYVSTVLFNQHSQVIHDREDLENIKPMTEDDYRVSGCTALLDAMGDAIKHISKIRKYFREEDVPEKTIFVITTDGMENASHKYTNEDIKMLVDKYTELGWEFLFLGANIDSFAAARRIGIKDDYTTNFISDKRGTKINYECVADAVCDVRKGKKLNKSWKAGIERDYNERK